MDKTRRKLLLTVGIALATAPLAKVIAANEKILPSEAIGNFRYIYNNTAYKAEFYTFLVNVFHLYPEDKLHELIASLVAQQALDRDIYQSLQHSLPKLKPLLADLSYALPALKRQKSVMANQTAQLVDIDKRYEGFLEVGSTGRYLDALEEKLDIKGDIFFLSDQLSSYSPVDIIDRGQILKAGKDISLNNYDVNLLSVIPKKSLDLATVYIGFHHCPIHLREAFIGSIRDAMKDNGTLILRDHDAHDEKMWRMVALAHDVFNMGTSETWAYNSKELRLFYSLNELEVMMKQYGFKTDGRKLFQQGDPTRNALMAFSKA